MCTDSNRFLFHGHDAAHHSDTDLPSPCGISAMDPYTEEGPWDALVPMLEVGPRLSSILYGQGSRSSKEVG